MEAMILTAGNPDSYSGFFAAGWDYLSDQLAQMGIFAEQGPALSDDVDTCMEQLRQATGGNSLIIVMTSPQPRTATMIAALLAKGLGLELERSNAAEKCVLHHADKLGITISPNDLTAFSTVPAGAATLQNPSGFTQGYAISSRKQLLLVLPAIPSELQHSFTSYVGELISRFAQSETPAPTQLSHKSPPPRQILEDERPAKTEADSVSEVCQMLASAGLTVATAESGTSGSLCQLMSACSSPAFSPNWGFFGKEQLNSLEVSGKLLSQYGTVSQQAASALALAARSHAGTSMGVAITMGTAKQSGITTACLAITDGRQVWSKTASSESASKSQLRTSSVLAALGMLNIYAKGGQLPDGKSVGSATAVTAGGSPQSGFAGIKERVWGKINQTGSRSAAKGSEEQEMARRTNLLQRVRAGKTTTNDKIRLIAVGLFLVIFIGCMVYIASVFKESADNKKLTSDLKNLMSTSNDVDLPDSIKDSYPRDYLKKFAALYEQNADVAGWIKIPGTTLDYVTVQTSDNLYYDRIDFTRKTNQHGVPFVDYRVDQQEPSTNTVIYSHNMNDGQMFGELMKYKQLSFYKEHPLIEYDSVYHEGKYKIFAVVVCKSNDEDFNYHNFINKTSDSDMVTYVNKIRERSMINTTVDLRTDDKLLTLSTCDYSFKSASGQNIARFVVFARKVREGESTDVDVAGATLNTNPVMPQEWFDQLAKQQEAERKKQEEEQAAQAAAAVNKKWLYDYEIAELTTEEQKELASRREADAGKYLTTDERLMSDLDEKLYLIDTRKDMFSLYLTSDERNNSLSSRIRLAEDRLTLATTWLSNEEIRSAGSWSRIEALITERQNSQTANSKWLTEEENKTLSASDKKSLIAQRQKQASDAGVTSSELASASSWSEIQALISSKSADKEKVNYINSNLKWLTTGDGDGRTLSQLQDLVAQRKAQASDAGIDTSRYNRWADMKAAIESALANKSKALYESNRPWLNASEASLSYSEMKALIDSRKSSTLGAGFTEADFAASTSWSSTQAIVKAMQEQAGAAAKEKADFIAANGLWLTSGDSSLSLAELKSLVSSRKGQAQSAGVDTSGCSNWNDVKALIDAANTPTPPPSSDTPSSDTPSSDTPSSDTPSSDTPSSDTPSSDTTEPPSSESTGGGSNTEQSTGEPVA